ncbi:HTH_Tnp_Tc3_2 domain-containing protein [Trichonephila clavipes]|nr:HTH_Tnp_Tc3_2 domain-containing protein [Trichonephila clavipes]
MCVLTTPSKSKWASSNHKMFYGHSSWSSTSARNRNAKEIVDYSDHAVKATALATVYLHSKPKRNRRTTTTRVTSMVTASIGKATSAATIRQRLYMNARVPQVCVPLSVQSRSTRLKWYRGHGIWTVSDWSNAMFTDESRFAQ